MKTVETPKIYIVEDDIFYSEILKKKLKSFGHKEVETFSSGKKVLENLHKQPDIVLLDYNLGDITGLEVLKKIKAYNPNIQVVFLSGQEEVKIAVNCLKYGAFDYVLKNENTARRIQFLIRKIIQINRFIYREEKVIKARKIGVVAVAISAIIVVRYLMNNI